MAKCVVCFENVVCLCAIGNTGIYNVLCSVKSNLKQIKYLLFQQLLVCFNEMQLQQHT